MQQTQSRIDEVTRMEGTLAKTAELAARRIRDRTMKQRLSGIADRHRAQMRELQQFASSEEPSAEATHQAEKDERNALNEIDHSVGDDGLMNALSHVESEQADRYREAAHQTDDSELKEVLGNHILAFEEDQRVFLDQSVGIGEIPDPRQAP